VEVNMNKIRIVTLWIVALGAIPPVASAQTTAVGYAFGAPGFATCGCGESLSTLHAGGGGEARIGAFGVGADVGYLAPFRYFSEGFGMLSINGSYYLPASGRERRIQPFVTSGYTLGFREGTLNLWNVGGGADYWGNKRVGVRFEVRDHIHSPSYRAAMHFLGPRIGIVLRGK
jgi:hypothetical protein